eukprot:COSAG02_NODE_10466_length_1935_cov_1.978214_1_plen_237_part_00
MRRTRTHARTHAHTHRERERDRERGGGGGDWGAHTRRAQTDRGDTDTQKERKRTLANTARNTRWPAFRCGSEVTGGSDSLAAAMRRVPDRSRARSSPLTNGSQRSRCTGSTTAAAKPQLAQLVCLATSGLSTPLADQLERAPLEEGQLEEGQLEEGQLEEGQLERAQPRASHGRRLPLRRFRRCTPCHKSQRPSHGPPTQNENRLDWSAARTRMAKRAAGGPPAPVQQVCDCDCDC